MTTVYHALSTSNFTQDWTDTGLITANDNWDGVPSVVGYLGDIDAASTTPYAGGDPQTVLDNPSHAATRALLQRAHGGPGL